MRTQEEHQRLVTSLGEEGAADYYLFRRRTSSEIRSWRFDVINLLVWDEAVCPDKCTPTQCFRYSYNTETRALAASRALNLLVSDDVDQGEHPLSLAQNVPATEYAQRIHDDPRFVEELEQAAVHARRVREAEQRQRLAAVDRALGHH